MNDYSLVRLFDTSQNFVAQHIISLTPEDKRLRFGCTLSDSSIEKYVESTMKTQNTRTNSDFWFGIKLDQEIVATIHIAIRGDVAEFGLTTDANHRGRKLGQLLFARGYQLVTEYSISKIYLTCLNENASMRHIARKFGLVSNSNGQEIDALTHINYPVTLAQINEFKTIVEISTKKNFVKN